MTTSNSPSFGINKTPSYYHTHIGKPLTVYTSNYSRAGVVQKIEDEFLFLSPYVSNDYSSGRPVMSFREGLASRIRLDSILATEDLTFEELKGYCKSANEDFAEKQAEKISKNNKSS